MTAYIKAKLYLFIAVIVLVPLSIAAIYYYMTSTTVIHGGLNINKVAQQERVYTYSVFSDFYFRATKYDNSGKRIAMYGEVIPVVTQIGFDFKNNELRLQGRKTDSMVLVEMKSHEIDLIRRLRDFSTVFGEIVATQDQFYFDQAQAGLINVHKQIYGTEFTAVLPQAQDLYEALIDLPIDNLRLQPFKLDQVTENLKDLRVAAIDEWHPNLVEYRFGQDDIIYLHYVGRVQSGLIDDVIEKNKSGSVVVDTVKFHHNELSKITFVIGTLGSGARSNQIDAYLMDQNGYFYLLRFRAYNERSFDRYLPDFLKIAYSIYFQNVQGFNNWFAESQSLYELNYAEYVNNMKEIQRLENSLKADGLLEHFGLNYHSQPVYEWREIGQPRWSLRRQTSQNLVPYYQAFEHFFDTYGRYPEANEFAQELSDRQLLSEAMQQRITLANEESENRRWSFRRGSSLELQKICNTIDCVKDLKQNNWVWRSVSD